MLSITFLMLTVTILPLTIMILMLLITIFLLTITILLLPIMIFMLTITIHHKFNVTYHDIEFQTKHFNIFSHKMKCFTKALAKFIRRHKAKYVI